MVVVTILVGLIIGALVGTSGIGGAILLLPVLILVLKVPPLIAVGSDAVFAAITKAGAASVHWRQKTVDLALAGRLALGSIPGAIVGFTVLSRLQAVYGDGVGTILERLIGILLLLIPFVMVAQTLLLRKRDAGSEHVADEPASGFVRPILIGALGGTLVGLTAVGSGSIILILLLLAFRRAPATLVGTDIVHAVLLTGLTGALHFFTLSSVDLELVGLLLVGSLPGAYFGARLSQRLSPLRLRLALLVLLVFAGAMLVA